MKVEKAFISVFQDLIDFPLLPLSGRIRNKAEVDEAAVDAILSLNIISAKYLKSSHSSNR